MRAIGYARVTARLLAMILAFNAGSGYATRVGWGIVPMSIGAAVGILAMDAGLELVLAAEHRRLTRWADKARAAHTDETAQRSRDAATRRALDAPPPAGAPVSLRLLRPPNGDRT
jgi:hypothetical protein